MMSNTASQRSKFCLYAFLTFVLLACLWAGWRDLDPWLSQDEIREDIRSTIRWVIQVLILFLVPAAILLYFGAEAVARFRDKQRKSGVTGPAMETPRDSNPRANLEPRDC